MKLRYLALSAALIAGPVLAGDFQSLAKLANANPMQDSQLATIEGGAACVFNFGSVCLTAQGIGQTALTSQANLALGSFAIGQYNAAATLQGASNTNQ